MQSYYYGSCVVFPLNLCCKTGWAGSRWDLPRSNLGNRKMYLLSLGRNHEAFFFNLLNLFFFFNWNTIALLCCVSCCCTTSWIICVYPSPLLEPSSCSPSPPSRQSRSTELSFRAVQRLPTGHLLHTWWCIYVNATLSTHPTLSLTFCVPKSLLSTSAPLFLPCK